MFPNVELLYIVIIILAPISDLSKTLFFQSDVQVSPVVMKLTRKTHIKSIQGIGFSKLEYFQIIIYKMPSIVYLCQLCPLKCQSFRIYINA